MNRLRNKRTAIRFFLTSWCVVTVWILCVAVVVIGGLAAFAPDVEWLWLVLATGLSALMLTVLQLALGSTLHCPLCHGRPLFPDRCSLHKTASRIAGSHRLPVALQAAFLKWFRCPYCGEKTEVKSRQHTGSGTWPTRR